MILLLLVVAVLLPALEASPCVPLSFGHSSHVCVCNSTYCDEYTPTPASSESILGVTSNDAGLRFDERRVEWLMPEQVHNLDNQADVIELYVDRSKKYQSIIGFGGAFTDAAGINIANLSPEAQLNLIKAYYGPTGLEYGVGRTNIGGCDFSDRAYTLCDTEGDVELSTFGLTHDDYDYKIPFIKQAQFVSEKEIKLFASPWSAPAWMKSNNAINGSGYLLPEYYQSWANYFVKYLDSYKEEGIDFWGLTSQNEPLDGNIPDFSFNCMGWNATTLADFIGDYLGPALEEAGYAGIKLITIDDQRPFIRQWSRIIMSNPKAAKYVSGFGVHWYTDFLGFAEDLDDTHEFFPDKFIMYTEACTGSFPWDLEKVMLGSWYRGQLYISNIIEDLEHWSVGWTDWNLALSMTGGPNWANNFVDAPIIVDAEKDQFYKNPMYYGLGHFSKFLPENSVRIQLDLGGHNSISLQVVAFERPDGSIAIVATNRHLEGPVPVYIRDGDKISETFNIEPESVQTLVWN